MMDHYWIYDKEKNKYYCSICNFESDKDFDFCPSCGIRHHMTATKAEHNSSLQEEEI